MTVNILILLAGFIALVKGADWFVDGSAALAKNFRVPGLIVGLTIVAFGTSAPELAVSTSAALQGANEIALSNVVGSNIFNILCVLGVCAVISPLPADESLLKRDFPVSIITTIAVFLMTCGAWILSADFMRTDMEAAAGNVSRMTGTVIFLLFFAYIVYLIMDAGKSPEPEPETERRPLWKCFCFIVVGLTLIVGGGQAVVYGAKAIAQAAGMTETLIGLTVVAVGTSLPELATSVVAARKGETGLAAGNVIGSNIFNLLFILGVSAMLHPVTVNFASVCDLLILMMVSVLTYLFLLSGKTLKRLEGGIMTALYVLYVVFAAIR